jgi:hypothetical protein
MSRQGGKEPGAGPTVERYLAEIARLLPGPSRARADIVAELRSGLLDATDAHRSAGLPPAQAGLAAIREFGEPARVAAGFRAEVAAGHARRVVVSLLVTGPLVGLLWVATAVSSHLGIRAVAPWQWAGQPPGLRVGICLVAAAVGITAWAAVLAIAATGRLSRWLPAGPRRAPTAAAVAGFGAVSADGLGLLLFASQVATTSGKLSPIPAAAAAAASLTRLTLARRAARRCLAIRASLT